MTGSDELRGVLETQPENLETESMIPRQTNVDLRSPLLPKKRKGFVAGAEKVAAGLFTHN